MRVLVKVSGEALSRGSEGVFSDLAITAVVNQLIRLHEHGMDVVVVVGGGNIFRGSSSSDWEIERVEADNVGMLGTIANGILLRAKLEAISEIEIRLMSAVGIPQIGESYIRRRAMRHLDRRRLVLLCGGIGEPYVTTDYPSIQRSIELKCDCVLAFKNGIDAVYDSDPRTNPDAKRFRSISVERAITEALGFMDRSALVLAEQNDVKIHVVGFDQSDAAVRAVEGGAVGTVISKNSPVEYY